MSTQELPKISCGEARKLLQNIFLDTTEESMSLEQRIAFQHYCACNPCQAKGLKNIDEKPGCSKIIEAWILEPGLHKHILPRSILEKIAANHIMGTTICLYPLCSMLRQQWERLADDNHFYEVASIQNSLLIAAIFKNELFPNKDFQDPFHLRIARLLKNLENNTGDSVWRPFESLSIEVQETYEHWILMLYPDQDRCQSLKLQMGQLLKKKKFLEIKDRFELLTLS